jgi:hypothetical protein
MQRFAGDFQRVIDSGEPLRTRHGSSDHFP